MKSFFLSDPEVIKEIKITPFDYRIYHYLCFNFNVKDHTAFVRIVNIAGQYQLTQTEVKESLSRLSKIIIKGDRLLTIEDGPDYLIFDMPRHKKFLTTIGFRKHFASAGWKNLGSYLKQNKIIKKDYLYPKLDQHQLDDKLKDLSNEDLSKINPERILYPWILKHEKNRRTENS